VSAELVANLLDEQVADPVTDHGCPSFDRATSDRGYARWTEPGAPRRRRPEREAQIAESGPSMLGAARHWANEAPHHETIVSRAERPAWGRGRG
jgi:hypothetical protein